MFTSDRKTAKRRQVKVMGNCCYLEEENVKSRSWSHSSSRLREQNIDEPDWTINSEWLKTGFPEQNFWFKSVQCYPKGQIYRRVVFTQVESNRTTASSSAAVSEKKENRSECKVAVDCKGLLELKDATTTTIPINTSFSYLVRLSSGDFLLLDDQFEPAYTYLILSDNDWDHSILADSSKFVSWQWELFLDLMKKGMDECHIFSTRKAVNSHRTTSSRNHSSLQTSVSSPSFRPSSSSSVMAPLLLKTQLPTSPISSASPSAQVGSFSRGQIQSINDSDANNVADCISSYQNQIYPV